MKYVYINNKQYEYPPLNDTTAIDMKTGWQLIPNMLFGHLMNGKDWLNLIMGFEAYHVSAIKATVFNMIPLTESLAIQGNVTFAAFNNTIYALGYNDDLYETTPYNWQSAKTNFLPVWHEGISNLTGTNATINLPEYVHVNEKSQGSWDLSGAGLWDPFNRPETLMELRPGKNAISFSWTAHSVDSDIWFNLDNRLYAYPYDVDMLNMNPENLDPVNRPPLSDWATQPIVRTQYIYSEVAHAMPEYKMSLTETEYNLSGYHESDTCYKYPPTQWFMKLIPLFDSKSALINTTAQVAIMTELILKVKKRRSAYYNHSANPFAIHVKDVWGMDPKFSYPILRERSGGRRRLPVVQKKSWNPYSTAQPGRYTQSRPVTSQAKIK